ncbi:MAG: exodeoxyribonuclease VII small subunit [Rhodospirillaceae bacterium]
MTDPAPPPNPILGNLVLGNLIPPDIANLSFEDALGELERIVRQLEDGRSKLDDAISAYERGTALKRHCEARLREAQARIDRITVAANGSVTAEPAQID